MLGRAQLTKVTAKLGRPGAWGCAAAVALVIAILAGRSDAGAQRIAVVASALNLGASQSFYAEQAPPDYEAAARQLAQTVRGLTEDRDRLMTRLAAIEQNLDDMTGSISRQIEAAKSTQPPALWPDDMTTTPAAIAAMIAPPNPLPPGIGQLAPDAPAAKGYGADLGSSLSIKSLHARWVALRAAHPQLFEGVRPAVMVHENPKTNRTELRLVVGPFPSADAAAQLCISLAVRHQACQPTMFDGRLALQ